MLSSSQCLDALDLVFRIDHDMDGIANILSLDLAASSRLVLVDSTSLDLVSYSLVSNANTPRI